MPRSFGFKETEDAQALSALTAEFQDAGQWELVLSQQLRNRNSNRAGIACPDERAIC